MLAYILIAVIVLIIGILAYASTKPDMARYERSTVMNAAPEKIMPHVSNFHKWMAWSPYEKFDPNMKRTYSGAAEGKGAQYAWDGNNKAGTGNMEILESSLAGVKLDLHFIKPFKTDCLAMFTFVPEGAATKVTWTMDGPQPMIARVMGIFMNMDKLVGGQFAEGLANLKGVVEK